MQLINFFKENKLIFMILLIIFVLGSSYYFLKDSLSSVPVNKSITQIDKKDIKNISLNLEQENLSQKELLEEIELKNNEDKSSFENKNKPSTHDVLETNLDQQNEKTTKDNILDIIKNDLGNPPEMEIDKVNDNENNNETLNKNDIMSNIIKEDLKNIENKTENQNNFGFIFNKQIENEQKIMILQSILSHNDIRRNGHDNFITNNLIKNIEYPTKNNQIITKNDNNIKEIKTFQVLPGSTYYGILRNTLYSQANQNKALIEITNGDLKGCNILGNQSMSTNQAGLYISLNQLTCAHKDINIQVQGSAVQVKNFNPIFADEVKRHIGPKLGLVTIQSFLNALSTARETTSSLTDGLTSNTTTDKGQKEEWYDYVQPDMGTVNGLINEELNRYQTEILAYPQAVFIVFY